MRFKATVVAILLGHLLCAQPGVQGKVDLSPAQAYVHIARQLLNGHPEQVVWSTLFQTPPCQMMIQGGALDTAVFKREMIQTYTSVSPAQPASYHTRYRDQLTGLENYIIRLTKAKVEDSVKRLLYPFLPARLQQESLFPQLYYLYYGQDATGANGMVFNDLLLSYRADSYRFGLVASHEAFHAVVSQSTMMRLQDQVDFNGAEMSILFLMGRISEEGIADLIDKPVLGRKDSPLYADVKALESEDGVRAAYYIRKIDSLCTIANREPAVWKKFASFEAMANEFGRQGGHVPGRWMGQAIQAAGLLKDQIQTVDDPFSFFIRYHQAAVALKRKQYPTLSPATLTYLEQLRRMLFKVS